MCSTKKDPDLSNKTYASPMRQRPVQQNEKRKKRKKSPKERKRRKGRHKMGYIKCEYKSIEPLKPAGKPDQRYRHDVSKAANEKNT
jgi:hypothetical protein